MKNIFFTIAIVVALSACAYTETNRLETCRNLSFVDNEIALCPMPQPEIDWDAHAKNRINRCGKIVRDTWIF